MKHVLGYLVIGMLATTMCSAASAQPQDQEIVYSRLTDGFWQVWIVDPQGTASKQLTFSPVDKRSPVWIDSATRIMYRTSNAAMMIYDVNAKAESAMLEKFGSIAYPAWSKANQRLAFTRYEEGVGNQSEIWTVALDGSDEKIFTREPGMQYGPAWSPDGKSIVYTSGNGSAGHELWIMAADGSGKRQLTANEKKFDITPAFSPDGAVIAFASDRGGNFDIWTMQKDGSGLKNLTNNAAFDSRPQWSPDGKKVVFTSTRGGSLQLWMMNSDGSNARQLTSPPAESQDSCWSLP